MAFKWIFLAIRHAFSSLWILRVFMILLDVQDVSALKIGAGGF